MKFPSASRARATGSLLPVLLLLSLGVGAGCGYGANPPFRQIHDKTLADWSADLRNSNYKIRQKAVRALGNAGDVDAGILPLLTNALQDRVALVRLEAVTAIEKMGKTALDSLPALKQLANDADPKVRAQAVKAVKALEGS